MHEQSDLRTDLGFVGRAFARNNLAAEVVVGRLEAEMKRLAEGATGVGEYL